MQRHFLRPDGKTLQYTRTRSKNYDIFLTLDRHRHDFMATFGNGLKSTYHGTYLTKDYLGKINQYYLDEYQYLVNKGILSKEITKQPGLFTKGFAMVTLNDREFLDFIFQIDSSPTPEFVDNDDMQLRTTNVDGSIKLSHIPYHGDGVGLFLSGLDKICIAL